MKRLQSQTPQTGSMFEALGEGSEAWAEDCEPQVTLGIRSVGLFFAGQPVRAVHVPRVLKATSCPLPRVKGLPDAFLQK